MKLNRITLAATIFVLLSNSAYAGNGKSPQGKPFLEIDGQLAEVNQRIDDMEAYLDTIVTRVDTLEGRISANESAISNLESENAAIKLEIDDLASLSSENAQDIQSLMQSYQNNLDAITALEQQIEQINQDLQKKQDILNGSCPPNMALSSIDPDGIITCVESGPNYKKTLVTSVAVVPAAYTYETYNGDWRCAFGDCYTTHWVYPEATVGATCPYGTFMSGGYGSSSSNIGLTANYATYSVQYPANTWIVASRNYSSYPGYIYANAICVSFQ